METLKDWLEARVAEARQAEAQNLAAANANSGAAQAYQTVLERLDQPDEEEPTSAESPPSD